MITQEQARIGTFVTNNVEFSRVPVGTIGLIDGDYGVGIMVAWDLKDQPLPPDYIRFIKDNRKAPPIMDYSLPYRSRWPLRDGFSYGELKLLDLVDEPHKVSEPIDSLAFYRDYQRATGELEEAKKLLKELVDNPPTFLDHSVLKSPVYCAFCKEDRKIGHTPDCFLLAAEKLLTRKI